jgi:hypothetical protein
MKKNKKNLRWARNGVIAARIAASSIVINFIL